MAVSYIRVSFSANELKKRVSENLNTRCIALQKDKTLANQIAREYGNAVTPFVPRSTRGKKWHHLQAFTVSDGRVTWYRPATNDIEELGIKEGDDIAQLLYEGPLFAGQQFRSRYNGHTPSAHWDENVRPGTPAWDKFVETVTPIIKERMTKDG